MQFQPDDWVQAGDHHWLCICCVGDDVLLWRPAIVPSAPYPQRGVYHPFARSAVRKVSAMPED